MRLEELSYRDELFVQPGRDPRLEVFRMQLSVRVCLCEFAERLVDDVAPELRIPRNHQLPASREQDEPSQLEDGIADRLFRGAERLPDLPFDLARAVVQEDARVRSRLRHLPCDEIHATAAIEGWKQRRVQRDDLLPPELRRDVAVQHMRVPLVHAAQREVQVHPVDVRDLHRRVDQLRRVEVRFLLPAPHDREGPPDPRYGRGFRGLDHGLPVFRVADEFVRVQVLDGVRDADRAESVLEILRADPEVLEVPAELVVDVRMPVREEDDRVESGLDQVFDLRPDDERRADVHEAGRLKANVRPRGGGPIEERPQLVAGDDLFGAAQHGLEPVPRGHKPPNLRKQDKGFNTRPWDCGNPTMALSRGAGIPPGGHGMWGVVGLLDLGSVTTLQGADLVGAAVGVFVFVINVLILLFASLKVVKEYERIVNFRLGKAQAERALGSSSSFPGSTSRSASIYENVT